MIIYKNSGLVLSMQSAIASAKTITAITQAAPGVVTSVAHGYSNGDIVKLTIEGMQKLNGRAFQVINVATDTFQLADVDGATGIDTSTYDAFTSGTAEKITLGTTIPGVQEFKPSGGDPIFLDTTTVSDLFKKQIVGGANPISFGLTMQWDPADTAQKAMRSAFEAGDQKVFKIKWPNGRFMLFVGSVGFAGVPGGSNQGITTSEAAVAMAGNPTFSI